MGSDEQPRPDDAARTGISAGAADELARAVGPATGRFDDTATGRIIDRSHTTAPHDLGRMICEELAHVGVRDVAIWLNDYDQVALRALYPAMREGVREETLDGSVPGRAFSLQSVVEQPQPDGALRLWVPLVDGTERVGVLGLTLDDHDESSRGYVRRMASTIGHLIFTKGLYTDEFARLRRGREFTVAAEMQWNLLPPLSIETPEVALAGLLEPAARVAGDSFDYALNTDGLHFGIFDAMGHGLDSAVMATTVVSCYRSARRRSIALPEQYQVMDAQVVQQFGGDSFVTAQLATLHPQAGLLTWVNAGHPPPLLVRGRKAVRWLTSDPTMPVGYGGAAPSVSTEQLEPGDRVLFYTDGVVEQRDEAGEMFGEERLAERLVRHLSEQLPNAEVLRRLNRDIMQIVGDRGLTDDATLVLVKWTGPAS